MTGSALRNLIRQAVDSGAPGVTVPAGTYRLDPDPSGKAHLLLENVQNLVVEARGVELTMTDGLKTPLVALYNCRNVTIRGLTVDCDPVVFVQGRIVGMAPDRAWYDLEVDPDYRLDPAAAGIRMRPMSVLDRDRPELSWKHGVPDLFPERVEWVSQQPRILRIFVLPHCRGQVPVAPGDAAVFPAFGAPGFTCRGSVDITFDDCTIYQSGSMAFHEHGGDGNTRLLNCRVLRRPGSGRLLSTNADGFHSKNMRKGPTVENCLFEGMHDDGINVHGMFGAVAGTVAEAAKVRVVPYFEDAGKAGDRLEFFSARTGASLGQRVLRAATLVDSANRPARAAEYHHGSGYGLLFEYELDRPISLQDHDAAINLDLCGRGFSIRNSEFRALRYRAILLRSLDGLVADNSIFAVGNDGIVLQSDLFSEGPYAKNIQVRNNSIERVGMIPFMSSGRGISLWTNAHNRQMDLANLRLNSDILIENNRIADVTRDGIYLRNARNVQLRGNTVADVAQRPVHTTAAPKPVSVAHVDRLQAE